MASHRSERERPPRRWPWALLVAIVVAAMAIVGPSYIQMLQGAPMPEATPGGQAPSVTQTPSVEPTPQAVKPKTRTMKVTVPWRNVRSAPTTTGNKPLKHLSRGDMVAVIGSVTGQDPYRTGQKTWYRLADGTYIWSPGLVEMKPATPKAKTSPAPQLKPAPKPAKPTVQTKPAPKMNLVGATSSTTAKYVRPVNGKLTSGYGMRWGKMHQGIDIANRIGTPIYAVTAGKIISAGRANGFGLWVRLRQADGTITVYGHVNRYFVHVGEKVPAGYRIAEVGNQGHSFGPHLHFEVWRKGRSVNPLLWLAARGIRYHR